MALSGKKILGFGSILLVIAVLLAGYFIYLPKQQKLLEDDIALFIDSLPGDLAADSIKVNVLGNSAEIHGLRGTTKYMFDSEMVVDVGSITLKGVNLNLGKEKGVSKVADALSLADAAMKVTYKVEGLPQPMTQDITLKSVTMENIHGDCSNFGELFGDAPLQRKLDIGASFSAGPVKMKNYVVSSLTAMGPVTISIESCEVKESSLLAVKDAVWENIRGTAMNTEIVGLDRMTLESMHLPDFFASFVEAMEKQDFDAMGAAILEKIEQDPLILKGLVLEGYRVQLMAMEPVAIKKLALDLEASAKKFVFQNTLEQFTVPQSIYGISSIEAAQFSAFYNKPLVFDLRLNAELTQNDGAPAEIRIKDFALQEQNLASLQASGDVINSDAIKHVFALFDSDGPAALKNAKMVLEDKALVETLFQSELKAQAGATDANPLPSTDAMREQAAQNLLAAAGPANPEQAALLEGLVKLLRAPGKLVITMSPETPVELSARGGLKEGAWGTTVEYTPAQ